jgi:hypothetical protein
MNHPDPPADQSPAAVFALAIFMGAIAVLACGVPFVPPLAIVAVPLAGVPLVLMARDGFAFFLALGHHHLIDFLEGH